MYALGLMFLKTNNASVAGRLQVDKELFLTSQPQPAPPRLLNPNPSTADPRPQTLKPPEPRASAGTG